MAITSKKANFDLSKWFNATTSLEKQQTASIETVLSKTLRLHNTNEVDLTKDDEDDTLSSRGRPSTKKESKQQQDDGGDDDDSSNNNNNKNNTKQEEEEETKEQDPESAKDADECYVCGAPNPEYMSTKEFRGIESVTVCGVNCERDYLRAMGRKPRVNDHREMLLRNKRVASLALKSPASKRRKSEAANSAKKNKSKSRKQARKEEENGVEEEEEEGEGEGEGEHEPEPEEVDLDDDDDELLAQDASTSGLDKNQRRSLRWFEESFEDQVNGTKVTRSWWTGALAFFDFVYQRHGMWHSYAMGDMDPKVDPELIRYGTCNIYRELDRSTAYLRKHVIRWQQAHQGKLSVREVLWMTIVFRLCNRLETFHHLKSFSGIPSTDSYNKFKISMAQFAKRHSDKEMFGPRRSMSMVRYFDTLDKLLANLDELTIQIKESESSKDMFESLRMFQNNALGSFTCWQVVADLLELRLLGKRNEDDEFVWLSAEAKLSLEQIFGQRRARATESVSLAKVLQLRQIQAFRALDVTFPFFANEKLDLKNIGHALHGFQHYRNIKLIQMRRQGRFMALKLTCHPRSYESRSYMADGDVCELCAKGGDDDKMVLCDLCNRMFHSYCLHMDELPPASWVCTECEAMNQRVDLGLVMEDSDDADEEEEEEDDDDDDQDQGH